MGLVVVVVVVVLGCVCQRPEFGWALARNRRLPRRRRQRSLWGERPVSGSQNIIMIVTSLSLHSRNFALRRFCKASGDEETREEVKQQMGNSEITTTRKVIMGK